MKKIILLLFLQGFLINAFSQHKLQLQIKCGDDKHGLPGATASIGKLNLSAVADTSGTVVFENLPAGKYAVTISFVGYSDKELNVSLPASPNAIEVFLQDEHGHHEEEEVIISTTRTSRTITNTPTRVEIISGEELEEKANMKPGDIRMLLNESTGIQTQQTSATSYNSSIRIQGLDGRYTQILRDGFPLYAGFSGGLSIMQIAPLDLKQVEVIKGSSSTLYGGGAIAGLVNLISKAPRDEREISFMVNGTSAKGLDISSFYSQKMNRIGVTLFASANYGSPYDPADIGLTAIPKFQRYTFNPKLFFYSDATSGFIGVNYITEDRTGGSIDFIKNNQPGYFEKNTTDRFVTQAALSHRLGDVSSLNFKNSFSRFFRTIDIPGYAFQGLQTSTFTEATFNASLEKTQWVLGLNVLTDGFEEEKVSTIFNRNYDYTTLGIFAQNNWSPSETFSLETGVRGDYTADFGFEFLPRISMLYKATPSLGLRLGGGYGYKTPTVFNEDAERMHFQNIFPISNNTHNERSAGANFDINYRTNIGDIQMAFNQLFFYTKLKNPLVLTPAFGGLQFENSPGYIDTKGFETNLKLTLEPFKLFIGYTFVDANSVINQTKERYPLTAKHRLNNVLMYEVEEKWKIGLEAYYTSRQKLNDGTFGKPYWITGFMVEKLWEKFSLFINFENFTDTRQTKFDTIYTGTITQPAFRDIYAPVDGFVINGGFKLRL